MSSQSCIPRAARMVLDLLDSGMSRKEATRKTAEAFGMTENYIDQYTFRYLRKNDLLPKWGEVRKSPRDEPPMEAYARRHKNFFAKMREAGTNGSCADISIGNLPKGGPE